MAKTKQKRRASRPTRSETPEKDFDRDVRMTAQHVMDILARPAVGDNRRGVIGFHVPWVQDTAAFLEAVEKRLEHLPVGLGMVDEEEMLAEVYFHDSEDGKAAALEFHRQRLRAWTDRSLDVVPHIRRLNERLKNIAFPLTYAPAGFYDVSVVTHIEEEFSLLCSDFYLCNCTTEENQHVEDYDANAEFIRQVRERAHKVTMEGARRISGDVAQAHLDTLATGDDITGELAEKLDSDMYAKVDAEVSALRSSLQVALDQPLDSYSPGQGIGLDVRIKMPFSMVINRFRRAYPQFCYLEFGPAAYSGEIDKTKGSFCIEQTDDYDKMDAVLMHFLPNSLGSVERTWFHTRRKKQLQENLERMMDAINRMHAQVLEFCASKSLESANPDVIHREFDVQINRLFKLFNQSTVICACAEKDYMFNVD